MPAPSRSACASCGGEMAWDPAAKALKCGYCGGLKQVDSASDAVVELDFRQTMEQLQGGAETQTRPALSCGGCGATITLSSHVVSDLCPYCGATINQQVDELTQIKPAGVLPFSVPQDVAQRLVLHWLRKRWFLPKDFRQALSDVRHPIEGVYLPFWTYDFRCIAHYTGQRGEYYYTTESYTVTVNGRSERRTRQVRHTRWWPASGVVHLDFDDVLILASRSLPTKYVDRLEPWLLGGVVNYDESYLSGFRAECYRIDLAEGFGLAEQRTDGDVRSAIRRHIGGDEQRISTVSKRYPHLTYKHLLLPVWVAAFRHNNKPYRVMVNARTGEVQGQRPWNVLAVVLVVLLVILGLVGLGLLISLAGAG